MAHEISSDYNLKKKKSQSFHFSGFVNHLYQKDDDVTVLHVTDHRSSASYGCKYSRTRTTCTAGPVLSNECDKDRFKMSSDFDESQFDF